jgi:anti-sigma-K factor RskA
MRGRGSQLHTLVGAYVMDSVPSAERTEFERHLQVCEQCREDVRGLRETTAALAFGSAEQPRPQLRESTLRAVDNVRQLPPELPGERSRAAGAHARRRRLATWLAGGSPRGWLSRVAVAAAVVVAVAAVVLGLHMSSMQQRLSLAEQRDHDIAAVLGATDATTLTAKASTGGMATVVMSHRASALVVITRGLPALPASEGYEVWLMNPAGDRPVGMLPAARAGMTDPMVVGRLRTGDQLGLTVEPSGGSRQPTSAPIVLVSLGA